MDKICYELGVMLYRTYDLEKFNMINYDFYGNARIIIKKTKELLGELDMDWIKKGFFAENENDNSVSKENAENLYEVIINDFFGE